ncbi:MAG: fimbria major subunit [Muribaculaceae bacterium]|nr:fimbria major subunit [Muribaculaceae bacterium]
MKKQSNNFKKIKANRLKGCRLVASMLFTALMAVATSSCTDDLGVNPDVDFSGPKYAAGTKLHGYIRLLPVDGVPTRADDNYGDKNGQEADFVPGDKNFHESDIQNMLVIFFDKEGNHITHVELSKNDLNDKEENEAKKDELDDDLVYNEEDGVIEKWGYNVLIPIDVEVTEEMEKNGTAIGSYFVILNYDETLLSKLKPFNPSTQTETKEITEIALLNNLVTVRSDSGISNSYGFLMTTAGHFDLGGNFQWKDFTPKDPETNKDRQILFPSKSDARKNPVTIYVERLAARVDFEIDTKNIEPIEVIYNETGIYKLIFTPDYWALEATEKNSYIPKQLEKPKGSDFFITNVYPSDFYDWTNYNNNRVFWAKSINFEEENTYPATGTEKIDNLTLNYLTFGDIKDPSRLLKAKSTGSSILQGKLYCTEHTFKGDVSLNMEEKSEFNKTDNPYAVPTSVVLCGRYTAELSNPGTDEKDENGKEDAEHIPTAKTLDLTKGFYLRYVDMERTDVDSDPQKTYRYHLYLENNNGEDELLTAMLAEQYMIWEPVRDEKGQIIYDNKGNIADFTPVRESKNGLLTIANSQTRYMGDENLIEENKWIAASNTYTLQIDEEELASATDKIYLKTTKDETPLEITSANLQAANRALQKQLGYAQRYWQGYAFFYAPIPHYSGKYDPFKSRNYDGLFNYDMDGTEYKKSETTGNYIVKHYTGDFGVVRNHIYNIAIRGIGNLGYGIPGENVIPLPEPRLDHKLYQFDLELKILPWNVYEYTFDIEGRK